MSARLPVPGEPLLPRADHSGEHGLRQAAPAYRAAQRPEGAESLRSVLAVMLVAAACAGPGGDEAIPLADLTGVESPIARAVQAARKTVRKSPGLAAAWGALADRYYVHDWFREAAECYSRAAELDPTNPAWPYRRGHSLKKLDDLGRAEETLSRAVDLNDDYAPGHVALAEVLVRLGRPGEARAHYERAAALEPASAAAMLGLGQVAISSGRFDEARRYLEQALQRNPRYGEVHHALAQAYLALGDEAKASFHSEQTRGLPKYSSGSDPLSTPEVEPVGSRAHNTRGSALADEGRLDEAEAEFRKAIRIKPEYTEAYYNLGTVLARQGRVDEAIEYLSEAVRMRPRHPDAQVNLAVALSRRERLEEAETHFRQALALNPDHGRAHAGLATLLDTLDRPAEAAGHYRAALEVQPDWPEGLRHLAWILATSEDGGLRDGEQALALARRACAVTANQDPLAIDALAAAYAELGRFDQAVSTARRATALASDTGRSDLAAIFENRMRAYEAGRPYRE